MTPPLRVYFFQTKQVGLNLLVAMQMGRDGKKMKSNFGLGKLPSPPPK